MNVKKRIKRPHYIPALLSLLSSSSTLICCALPALLVALGAGAVLSGLVTAVPQLVILSEYKEIVFALAFLILLGNGGLQWHNRNAPCPVGLDVEEAQQCMEVRRWSLRIYFISVGLFIVGAWFAFVQPYLFAG